MERGVNVMPASRQHQGILTMVRTRLFEERREPVGRILHPDHTTSAAEGQAAHLVAEAGVLFPGQDSRTEWISGRTYYTALVAVVKHNLASRPGIVAVEQDADDTAQDHANNRRQHDGGRPSRPIPWHVPRWEK